MKLGVLTGGSDAPGLNAVIRAVVRTATLGFGSDVVGIGRGFDGLLRPPEVWPLGPGDVRGLGRRGGTILGSCNRANPFDKDGRDRSDEVLETVRWLGIDALVCVGGDGSLAIARRLADLGVPIVGIPKTIENHLQGTGITFGFATAVETATDAIDRLQTSRESAHQVMVLEVTGRRAGWIALSAGIAGGADVILIPEVPHRAEVVADVVVARRRQNKPSTVVVVAEGARAEGEEAGPTGGAQRVAARLRAALPECEPQVTVLGHLQRGGAPNYQDRILATRFGAAAVRAAHAGRLGHMVGIVGNEVALVPLAEVTDAPKLVDPAGELVGTALDLGTSLGVVMSPRAAARA